MKYCLKSAHPIIAHHNCHEVKFSREMSLITHIYRREIYGQVVGARAGVKGPNLFYIPLVSASDGRCAEGIARRG